MQPAPVPICMRARYVRFELTPRAVARSASRLASGHGL